MKDAKFNAGDYATFQQSEVSEMLFLPHNQT